MAVGGLGGPCGSGARESRRCRGGRGLPASGGRSPRPPAPAGLVGGAPAGYDPVGDLSGLGRPGARARGTSTPRGRGVPHGLEATARPARRPGRAARGRRGGRRAGGSRSRPLGRRGGRGGAAPGRRPERGDRGRVRGRAPVPRPDPRVLLARPPAAGSRPAGPRGARPLLRPPPARPPPRRRDPGRAALGRAEPVGGHLGISTRAPRHPPAPRPSRGGAPPGGRGLRRPPGRRGRLGRGVRRLRAPPPALAGRRDARPPVRILRGGGRLGPGVGRDCPPAPWQADVGREIDAVDRKLRGGR